MTPIAIDALPFATALREDPSLFAWVEAIHVLGIAMLIGPVVAFDLRVLGLSRHLAVSGLARHLLPLALASLFLIVPSGLAMFAAHASDLLTDSTFMLKMFLVLAGGGLAIAFHAGPYREVKKWDTVAPAPNLAKGCAVASILGWLWVLVLGKFLGVP